ncbi:MAG: M20 family metallopeptidase [Gammaproteobacteria bacterium]|nr:M20 family metallopeptidase [Gammaproteobacteria bacterium]
MNCERMLEAVDAAADELIGISRDIHARPELAFEEHYASERLTGAMVDHGMSVTLGVYGLETAFEAEFGSGDGPCVALLAEYDALPGIGHACGHNLIATAALGAAFALNALDGDLPGRVRLLGTPAEEKGGGKELMARAGAFDGVDAALMIHPSGINLVTMPCLCYADVRVVYHGRSAHASAMPHKGINALDGLLLAYQAISNLRQHIRGTERIHGIVTDGGQAPNIVPDRAAGEFYVRAATAAQLEALKPRVQACFDAGAKGAGCEVEITWGDVDYLDLNTNWPLAERFQHHAEGLGREFYPIEKLGVGGAGSTDMGNVSQRVPSIHPMLAAAPRNVVIHHPDFARYAGSELGDAAALDGARSLALTAFDFLADADLRTATLKAFRVAKGLA